MSFIIEDYTRSAAPVQTADLDMTAFTARPLSRATLRCLAYMCDVENHTICYLRDLLVTPSHADPQITTFLTMWAYEEYWHGEALAAVLDAHGITHGNEHTRALRLAQGVKDKIAPIKHAGQPHRRGLHRRAHDLGRHQRMVHPRAPTMAVQSPSSAAGARWMTRWMVERPTLYWPGTPEAPASRKVGVVPGLRVRFRVGPG